MTSLCYNYSQSRKMRFPFMRKLPFIFLFCYVHGLPFFESNENDGDSTELSLSKEGHTLVKTAQKRTPRTIVMQEHQQLNLKCNNAASKYLMRKFPRAEVRWKHNGKNFVMEPSRMTYKLNSLYIQSLRGKDSGVFTCQIDVSKTQHYVVSVNVVIVGQTILSVLPDDSVKLDCNSKQFGLLDPAAVRFWQHNGNSVDGSNDKATNTFHEISNMGQSQEGNWTCNVSYESDGKEWTTARYKLTLAPVPPIMTKVRIYVKNNRVQSGMMLMVFAFFVVVAMNLIMKLLEKKERAKKREIEQMKKMLGIETRDSMTLLTEGVPLLGNELQAEHLS